MIRLAPLAVLLFAAGCSAPTLPDAPPPRVTHTLTVRVGADGPSFDVPGAGETLRLPSGTALAVRLGDGGQAFVVALPEGGEEASGLTGPRVVRLSADAPAGSFVSSFFASAPSVYHVAVFACTEAGSTGDCARWEQARRTGDASGFRLLAGGPALQNERQFVPSQDDPPLDPDGRPSPLP